MPRVKLKLLMALAACCLAAAFAMPASAQDVDGPYIEMDATDNSPVEEPAKAILEASEDFLPPYDWGQDESFGGDCAAPDTNCSLLAGPDNANVDNTLSLENAFTVDSAAANPNADDLSCFKKGPSKDVNNIDQWLVIPCKGGNPKRPNSKTDIVHDARISFIEDLTDDATDNPEAGIAWAAGIFDDAGSSAFSLHLFQEEVELVGGQFFIKGTMTPYKHRCDDLIVEGDFTNGGVNLRVQIFAWRGLSHLGVPCPNPGGFPIIAGNLAQISDDAAANCPLGTSLACMTSNSTGLADTIDTWPFANKDGASDYGQNQFVEGILSLTRVFAVTQNPRCFSSVLLATRESPSENSALSDIAVGANGQIATVGGFCEVDIQKVCATGTAQDPNPVIVSGSSIVADYDITVSNPGLVPIFDVAVTDNNSLCVINETSTFDTIAAGGSQMLTATCTDNDLTQTPTALSNSVAVVAGSSDGGSDLSDSNSATCPSPNIQTGLTPAKDCAESSSRPATRITIETIGTDPALDFVDDIVVDVTFSAQNTGNIDLKSVTIRDDLLLSATQASTDTTTFTCTTDGDGVGVTCTMDSGQALDVNETVNFSGHYSIFDAPLMGTDILDDMSNPIGKDPATVTFGNTLKVKGVAINDALVPPASQGEFITVPENCPLCDSDFNEVADGNEDLCAN